jgi:AsmA family protein
LGVIADGVDLGDLQKLGDMTPFMTGKAGANIQLTGDGNTAHEMASSLAGVIVVTAEKGEILTGAAAGVSSALAAVFSPKGGDAALNCLAARFIAKNGVLNDNGLLIDSTVSTVNGKGNVNLGAEKVDLTLHAKTKLLDVGGLVPALQISGSLSDPSYSVDAVGVVKNVVGSLMNGNVDVISSTVPDIQVAPAGQNACVYTLDHPKAASSSSILPSGVGGQAGQNIKNIGNSLVKGLLGQ